MEAYLRTLGILSEAELDALTPLLSVRRLDKGEFFIREGETCEEVAYIQSGLLRSFYRNAAEEEITYCFAFGGELMAAFSSFISGQPTSENIQALQPAVLHILPRKELLALYAGSLAWQEVGRLLTEQQYVGLEYRISSFQKQRAAERYQALIRDHAHYLRDIPLRHLASYLGITPRHLSRLRREA